jgi:hypothetical protein
MLQQPKLKRKIDGSGFLPACNLTSAAFNPCYPIIAITLNHHLYVIAYGGEARKKRGQILFAISLDYPLLRYRIMNWSPSGDYLLTLEEDKEMALSVTLNNNRIKIFFYNSNTFCVNEIDFKEPLIPSPGMNTKFLWLDACSFIFADIKKDLFRIINLKTNMTYDETKIDLTRTLEKFTTNSKRNKFISFVSSLFVMPDSESPYIFFLTCCPTNHQHQRILYVDKISHKVVKIASLPGEVVEIAVTSTHFFLILQSRPYEDYKYNAPILWNVNEKRDDHNKCFFSEPFREKIMNGNSEYLTAEGLIFQGNSTGIYPFRSPCCIRLSPTENHLRKLSNSNPQSLFPYLTRLARASNLYVTNDYVYYVDKIKRTTKVLGLNHHFEYDLILKDDFLFPSSGCVAYFHPTKPLFLFRKKIDESHFDIYLLPWATDDDIIEYPAIDEDQKSAPYNQSVTFIQN